MKITPYKQCIYTDNRTGRGASIPYIRINKYDVIDHKDLGVGKISTPSGRVGLLQVPSANH